MLMQQTIKQGWFHSMKASIQKVFFLILLSFFFSLFNSVSKGTQASEIMNDKTDSLPAVNLLLFNDTQVNNFVPYFSDNFEGYALNESLTGNNPFDAAGRTTASREQSYSGNTSAKMEIRTDDNGGFGQWGGVLTIDPEIPKGGEIWVRLRVFWPAEFTFSADPWMKFMRLHNKKGDGSNGGYNDLYVEQADQTTSVLRCIKENHNIWHIFDGPKLPRDKWETYEMYLFVDDKSIDDGGKGRMRIWRDGQILFDRTDVPTITEMNGTIDYFYLFTYWNNETPPDNYLYIDDLVIATHISPPTRKDMNGNLFIGK